MWFQSQSDTVVATALQTRVANKRRERQRNIFSRTLQDSPVELISGSQHQHRAVRESHALLKDQAHSTRC